MNGLEGQERLVQTRQKVVCTQELTVDMENIADICLRGEDMSLGNEGNVVSYLHLSIQTYWVNFFLIDLLT
jgi:hypothetical protein